MKLWDFEYIKCKKPELYEGVRWAIGPVALFDSLFLVDFSSLLISEKNWRTVRHFQKCSLTFWEFPKESQVYLEGLSHQIRMLGTSHITTGMNTM
jgi:hypothetical protein